MTLYIYKVVKEYQNGTQGKRVKKCLRYKPNLQIGGLYVHLGQGFPGTYRVLSMTEEEFPD